MERYALRPVQKEGLGVPSRRQPCCISEAIRSLFAITECGGFRLRQRRHLYQERGFGSDGSQEVIVQSSKLAFLQPAIEVEDADDLGVIGTVLRGTLAQRDADDGADTLGDDALRRLCFFGRERIGHNKFGAALNGALKSAVGDGGDILKSFAVETAPGSKCQLSRRVPKENIAAFDAGELKRGIDQRRQNLLDRPNIVEPSSGFDKPTELRQIGVGP